MVLLPYCRKEFSFFKISNRKLLGVILSNWTIRSNTTVIFKQIIKENRNKVQKVSESSRIALSFTMHALFAKLTYLVKLSSVTYIIDSGDLGFTKIAIGKSWATCSRFIALPLTSNIQCLPCREQHIATTTLVIILATTPWLGKGKEAHVCQRVNEETLVLLWAKYITIPVRYYGYVSGKWYHGNEESCN